MNSMGPGMAPPPPGGAPPMPGSLPKNPAAGPGGPGSSPVMSPGGGKGNQAAADAQVKMAIQSLRLCQDSYDVYSDQFRAIADAIRSLGSVFGKATKQDVVPAEMVRMAQAAKQRQPFAQVPPAGMNTGRPPTPSPAQASPMPGGPGGAM